MATAELLSDEIKTFNDLAAADLEAGEISLINGLVCIAYAALASGAEGAFVYHGDMIEGPMAAVAIDAPAVAYWDDTAKVFTTVTTSNTKCGVFTENRAGTESTAVLELDNSINL